MPYKSDKQRKFFNVAENRAKLEAEGVDVNEWNQSSKGLKLPATAPVKKRKKQAGNLLDGISHGINVGGGFNGAVEKGLLSSGLFNRGDRNRAVPSLETTIGATAGLANRYGGVAKAGPLLRAARAIPGQAAPLLDKAQKWLSKPQLPPPPPKVVGPIQKYGQLLDMDRDELLEKLAHMELRNRAVQRIKAALKLPGSGEAANLLSSWKGDLAGTVRAANPTLLDKVKTMAQPHLDKATGWMDAHPTETLGIGGALGGAAIGGLSSLVGPRKKKRVLSNMLTGGLAGGALGLGGGALAQGLGLGESFGAMKGNISKAIEPVPEIKPQGKVQERIAKAETEKEVAEIAEAIKPVNSAGGAIGGMGIDTAKAVGNAVKDTTTSHPFATGAVGAPLAVGAHAAVNRKAVSSGRARLEPNVPNQGLNPLGSSTGVFGLDDGRFGVSVNAAEDAARGIQKAREMATRSKAPDLSTLRRYFPGVPDAQLVSTAQHVENQLNQTIQQRNAGVGPALAPAMHGPAAPPLHRPTGGDMLQRALGDTFTPPGQTPLPTAAPHAPPPRTMPRAAPPAPPPSYAVNITPQQQLRGATIAASEAAPWLAHDLPAWMARAMPRVNNAYRHGVKGIPPVAALAAIIQEHRRIAALNAARQGGETLAQP